MYRGAMAWTPQRLLRSAGFGDGSDQHVHDVPSLTVAICTRAGSDRIELALQSILEPSCRALGDEFTTLPIGQFVSEIPIWSELPIG